MNITDPVTPDLSYLGLEDHGETYALTVRYPDGAVATKELRKHFKGVCTDLAPEVRHNSKRP